MVRGAPKGCSYDERVRLYAFEVERAEGDGDDFTTSVRLLAKTPKIGDGAYRLVQLAKTPKLGVLATVAVAADLGRWVKSLLVALPKKC